MIPDGNTADAAAAAGRDDSAAADPKIWHSWRLGHAGDGDLLG